MLKEPLAKFAMRARHDFFTYANVIAAGIVGAGLTAVAAAISWRAQVGIQDLTGPIRAAGIFTFLGCAFLVAVRLVGMHRALDRESEELDARVAASDRRAEAATV